MVPGICDVGVARRVERDARRTRELSGDGGLVVAVEARITRTLREKPGLTRFLPATLENGTARVTPIDWKGSSDVPSLARSNAFIIAAADREIYQEGDAVSVLLQ